ncbi:MAG: molybdenum cofactor biosynthesis protein MoaE [Chloroflexi bacterium]|nr:molybdenum cofactor biosynthesis protein MoaE [Chloroflexota bacterium]
MKVNISLFAGLHDLVGKRNLTLELTDGATVDQLRNELGQLYPVVVPYLATLVCAVDDEYVPVDHALKDGDEVALIPPVSGGNDALFLVTSEPLDAQQLVEAVRMDESGAVTLFHGVARNHSDGRAVRALEYEAHASLAEKKLREVAGDVGRKFDITGIGVHHRTGRLEIGETSLLVAVSAAHRREAFEACHYAVDRIKEVVPIWKKEIWEDGGGDWVEGHAIDAPERATS